MEAGQLVFDPIEYLTSPRWQTMSLGLERTRALLSGLGDPQKQLRFVHVAGTNGKGSTCAFLASVFEQAGYRVGLFTSPAVYSFEERIRVNGQPIAYDELTSVTEAVKRLAETLEEHPTEFELLTGVAFMHFVRSHCDVVVVEVGMGGRLDSTNVIETPEVAVITPISFDHCTVLGDTLAKIAGEKAGIIKPGAPVVCAPQAPEAEAVIRQVAHERACPFVQVDLAQEQGSEECFSYRERHDLALGVRGVFQLENAATALDALDVLKQRGWTIPEEAIRAGLRRAHWPGRFEAVSAEPLIIFDGGHNLSGISALSASLEHAYPEHYRIIISGVLADKDYQDMAEVLVDMADEIIALTPDNARALAAKDYVEALRRTHEPRRVHIMVEAPSISAGVAEALKRYEGARRAHVAPLICVCGSLYLLGSVMEVLRQDRVVL